MRKVIIIIKSKGWNWTVVKDDVEKFWKNPSVESYYLVNRWKSQDKKDFLDLGCGLGRHSILFGKNDFDVNCFDISEDAINKTRAWAEEEKLEFKYKIGDMLTLPYNDEESNNANKSTIILLLAGIVIALVAVYAALKVFKKIEE